MQNIASLTIMQEHINHITMLVWKEHEFNLVRNIGLGRYFQHYTR